MAETRLFLGVDGGQSSTTALIGDASGSVLGAGAAGPCNHVGVAEGAAKLTGAVTGCVEAACRASGLDAAAVSFEAACFGMSGGPDDKAALLRRILRVRELVVTTDAVIALAGAAGGGPGIITIAGTGSIALGRNREGRTMRAGGWGYVFGDEGGGFDIARQAMRAALRQHEGWGPHTALTAKLLEATSARDANEAMHKLYTREFSRPRVAGFARLVEQAAAAGDAEAIAVLSRAGRELAALALAIRGRLFAPAEPVAVFPIGGVFSSRWVSSAFREALAIEAGTTSQPPRFSPAAGALLEAYRAAGLTCELSNIPEVKT